MCSALFCSRSADGGSYSSDTLWLFFVIFICPFAPPHNTYFSCFFFFVFFSVVFFLSFHKVYYYFAFFFFFIILVMFEHIMLYFR